MGYVWLSTFRYRAEVSGKLTLTGVYLGERIVVFPQPEPKPKDMKGVAQIGPLAFVVTVTGHSGKYKTGFELIDPDGERWGSKQVQERALGVELGGVIAYRARRSRPDSRCTRKRVEESPGSQGRVPGNAWGARAHGKCNRKYTAHAYPFSEWVRRQG